MSRTYYVIELTPKWLAILLVALAGLMVLAFAGGYGAAWSTLGGSTGPSRANIASGGEIAEVEIQSPSEEAVVASIATPDPPKPTVAPRLSDPEPTPTQQPNPTAVPTAAPTTPPVPTKGPEGIGSPSAQPGQAGSQGRAEGFLVQVLASSRIQAIEKARRQLVDLGFPNSGHEIVETRVAGGGVLLKLRIGPFPDRDSADRVMRRMQTGGFPDAWVVHP